VLERTDLDRARLPGVGPPRRGKVRDAYELADRRLLLVTTDRLSAFDRVLGCVPAKGQVLNQLSAWWFAALADVLPHHLLAVPDPNVSVVRECRALPVEVVVRAYITGVTSTSLWRQYEQGRREMYGLRLPEGLAKNDRLPAPVVTPTTKALDGQHDEPLSPAEVTERGLVSQPVWGKVLDAAVAIFVRGQQVAHSSGLVLVDTKYEFGLDDDGEVVLIDEVHTPDSSRYWEAATLEDRRTAGDEPDSADKELVRRRYAEHGYRGDGDPPPLEPQLAELLSSRYISVYERLVGKTFEPAAEPAGPRIETAVRAWLEEDDRP
jgi:phosphoribosylaminoimidazole-succinocarboxamide synthase